MRVKRDRISDDMNGVANGYTGIGYKNTYNEKRIHLVYNKDIYFIINTFLFQI